jgi:acetylornithine deacetylase/succinyl-diaminopimelate desuccinylase-like protein
MARRARCVFGSVAAFLALLASPALSQQAAGAATLTPAQQLVRDVYRELIAINTADSVGAVTPAAEAMAARFRAAGFPAADVQLLIPDGKPKKGNLVVRYRGRGNEKPILLLAHLDVVRALRSDWSRDPFELQEANGYFYGRGTSDDKAMAAVFVANLLRYKAEGWVPDRDIVLALTADEESGDANGASWLVETHRKLIDAAYAINEGADGTIGEDGKPEFLPIQAAEKMSVNYTLTVLNAGGHSSIPKPDNAIYRLSAGLVKLGHYTFPVALNPVSRAFFEQTAKVEQPKMAAAMRALVANPKDAAAAATISTNDTYRSMLRTTCVATRLLGGHAYNALPQTATANVNCRIVPTSTAAEVLASLQRIAGDTAIHVTYTLSDTKSHPGPPVAAVDARLLSAATALTQRMWAKIPVIPMMSTWATDGLYLRQAGIPSYGVSGMFLVPGEDNIHGRDEKMRVKSFYEGQEFLYQLVKDVAGPPAS